MKVTTLLRSRCRATSGNKQQVVDHCQRCFRHIGVFFYGTLCNTSILLLAKRHTDHRQREQAHAHAFTLFALSSRSFPFGVSPSPSPEGSSTTTGEKGNRYRYLGCTCKLQSCCGSKERLAWGHILPNRAADSRPQARHVIVLPRRYYSESQLPSNASLLLSCLVLSCSAVVLCTSTRRKQEHNNPQSRLL